MAAVALVSAKGSPGVTTATAALAAVAAGVGVGPALMAELDPSGGSVQVLTGTMAVPGLVDAAGRLRRETTRSAIEENTTMLPPGVPTLLAPASSSIAESVIESAGTRWLAALRAVAPEVFVDAGRWEAHGRASSRIVGADLVALVCRPTVAGVEHARHLAPHLADLARRPVAVVVVGDRPYAPAEVASHLDLPLAGTVAWDPRGVTNLWAEGASKRWLRSMLARSAASTLAGLAQVAGSVTGGGPTPSHTFGPSGGPRPEAVR
jgi:Flp pilus assembly CpaE family ATPase